MGSDLKEAIIEVLAATWPKNQDELWRQVVASYPEEAISALVRIEDPDDAGLILSGFEELRQKALSVAEDGSGLRRKYLEGLLEVGDRRAVEMLITALRGPDAEEMCSYSWRYVLNEDGRMERRGKVRARRDEVSVFGPVSIHSAAAEALERITGEKFGEDAQKWQEWYDARQGVTGQSRGK